MTPLFLLEDSPSGDPLSDRVVQEAIQQTLGELLPTRPLVRCSLHAPPRVRPAVIAGGIHRLCASVSAESLLPTLRLRGKLLLLGAGWRPGEGPPDAVAGFVYRTLLHGDALHSVCDDEARKNLIQAGIPQVANTACVTLWGITADLQAAIPTEKAPVALAMLDAERLHPELDASLLQLLGARYERVYAWPQSAQDRAYFEALDFKGVVLEPSWEGLDRFVRGEIPFDYVGLRLYGGIRCLQNRRRALVLEGAGRSAAFGRATGVPTLPRTDLDAIEAWIGGGAAVRLYLPVDEIARWKKAARALLAD